MEKRYAIVANGLVVDVVSWDGVSQWAPPAGTTAHDEPNADVGDSFLNGVLVKKPQPVNVVPPSASAMLERQREQIQEQLDAAIAALPSAQQGPFRLLQQLLKD